MPYSITKRGSRFAVVKQDGSRTFGVHATREKAQAQLRALYPSEGGGAAAKAIRRRVKR